MLSVDVYRMSWKKISNTRIAPTLADIQPRLTPTLADVYSDISNKDLCTNPIRCLQIDIQPRLTPTLADVYSEISHQN